MCFMLAYCAKSIADLLKPCGDLNLGHQVTKSPYAMACLHLRAVPDAFLMESDGRTLCLHMLIRKPTGSSHISGDTKQGPNKQGLAKAVCTVFVVAEHFKQSRNMNCLNLVTTAFWATLFSFL